MLRALLLSLFALALALPAAANDYTLYVAPRGTDAYAFAEQQADNDNTYAHRSLHRALTQAGELLASGSPTVRILVAGGEFDGQFGAGTWALASVDNPRARLHILGGYAGAFDARTPFDTPTLLKTSEGRGGPIFTLGQRSVLKEFVFSGFVLDAGPSNVYDDDTNSLVRGSGTRTYTLLSFRNLRTERLVVADNVFVNGPQGAMDPTIAPAARDTRVLIQNNFFLNTLIPIQQLGTMSWRGNRIATLALRHNTFLMNWPFNPDPTSSNVGAVSLYHKEGTDRVEIEGNLFAYNVGGAMQHDWPFDRMPDLAMRNNLFFANGSLFDEDAGDDTGVLVGKFGPNPRYLVIDLYGVEDDTDYDGGGNVILDPDIPVDLAFYQESEMEEDWAEIYVDSYAPRMELEPGNYPFPGEAEAQKFGVQPAEVYQP
ncbi:MAG: hypothetical protein AAFN13_04790 [Bacteroidota bacterium]